MVVLAFGGRGLSAATAAGNTGDQRDAGASTASCLSKLESRPHRLLVLLTDGSAGDQQEVIRGAYEVAGAAVPMVGGCAGGERADQRAFRLDDGAPSRMPVVAAALGSYAPMGIGVRHGWRKVGDPMLVTHSEGHHLHTLDDRPALDVYLDRLDAPGRGAPRPGRLPPLRAHPPARPQPP